MRWLTSKRLWQVASLLLFGLTLLFTVLWGERGIRPAIDCGLTDALSRSDWGAAWQCIDLAEYDALLAAVALAMTILTWLASRKAPNTPIGEYNPTPAEHARNRKAMLDRVQTIWIDGVLEQSLYQAVLLHLGMTHRIAVPRPGSIHRRKPNVQEHPLPADIPTLQIFEEAQHSLLILGEPGAGKSTEMLDLARALLVRAKTDETVPIPVVFNLSSFTAADQSFDDWLVGEFYDRYAVPEKVARYWLAHNELALLLDGLDEVQVAQRANVVAKLKQYREAQLAPWLVVCCRKAEYHALSKAGSVLA